MILVSLDFILITSWIYICQVGQFAILKTDKISSDHLTVDIYILIL